jgi:hypothetical protein
VLTNDLKAAQKTLSDEKFVRLGIENSLDEEKASKQAAEQSLHQSKDVNTTLALELENVQSSLSDTHDKLDSKSKALDSQVIRAGEAMLRLKAVEEDLRNQMQLLE